MVTKYYFNGREISYSEKLCIEAKEFRKSINKNKLNRTIIIVEEDEQLEEALDGAWHNGMF